MRNVNHSVRNSLKPINPFMRPIPIPRSNWSSLADQNIEMEHDSLKEHPIKDRYRIKGKQIVPSRIPTVFIPTPNPENDNKIYFLCRESPLSPTPGARLTPKLRRPESTVSGVSMTKTLRKAAEPCKDVPLFPHGSKSIAISHIREKMENILQGSPNDSTNMKEVNLMGSQKTFTEHSFQRTAADKADKRVFSKTFGGGYVDGGKSRPTATFSKLGHPIAEVLSSQPAHLNTVSTMTQVDP